MRISISLVLVLAVVGCTKHNPLVCCTDPADCMANNIPVGSTCADGLLCRGNQCIAETCSSAMDCDASAPFCAGGSCVMSCTDDTQCPGNGQAASDLYCVSGTCVACRTGMNDCPANAPVCDMNACRACTQHSECASNVCDVDTGACIADTSIRYAAPAGVDTNDCSLAAPCTATKALSLVDQQHPWVRMLPGSYAMPSTAVMITGQTVTLVATGASWPGATLSINGNSNVTVRDLVGAIYSCQSSTTPGTLDLVNITSTDSSLVSAFLNNCNIDISASRLYRLNLHNTPTITIDRTEFANGLIQSQTDSGNGLEARITNSVFIDEANSTFTFGTPVSTSAIHVNFAYNTFYSDQAAQAWNCPGSTSPTMFTFTDNIFNAPNTDAVRGSFYPNTGNGGNCTVDTNVEYPQTTQVGTNVSPYDPQFVDAPNGDFHLMSTSPAKDHAKVIPNQPTVDFDGTTRPQGAGYDIGAFEYH